MKNGKLKVGVIGAGSWAISSHIPNLQSRPEVELTAVHRLEPDLVEKVKERFGFRMATTNIQDVLDCEPDVVVVASPAAVHFAHVKAALEAGAHVLCEKPFTLKSHEAWELQRIAEARGRHLVIAFGWNYKPMVTQVKRWMESSDGIGEIESMMVHMASAIRELMLNQGIYHGASQGFDPNPSTWTDPALSGGGYAQAQLTHALGLSLWISGLRGEEVFARMHTSGGNVDLHDSYNVKFTNGAIGSVFGASHARGPEKHQLQMRLFGNKGHLVLDIEREKAWIYRSMEDQEELSLKDGDGEYSCEGPVHTLIDLALGKTVINHSPAELGARTVEIIEAAYRSVSSGRSEKMN